ncbi:MAG: phosphoserine phosphatase SerB [Mariprofundaceae bacterium]|nr:phosphoserine phosphatase SerB [Mariprofundaceae bacterium]
MRDKLLLEQVLPSYVAGVKPNLQMYVSTITEVAHAGQIAAALAGKELEVVDILDVSGGCKLLLHGSAHSGSVKPALRQSAKDLTQDFFALSAAIGVDIALVDALPTPSLAQAGVLFMDMDSTLIQCECIDEIAGFLGVKDKVSAITQQAMEGKLDFSESLVARVQLLAGLDEQVLRQVYAQCICLTDGAEDLIQTVQQAGWKVGLVSGGFTFFTDLLQQRLKLDFSCANQLEMVGGKLTGRVLGAIVDANKKRELLLAQSQVWGIEMKQTMALGDGANDLPMLQAAGLGIAFHAKPKVRQLAPYALSVGGLNQALHLISPVEDA